ncbi:MAG: winged helix-turn-helix transcriptional regulator [Candidatus Hodarchaeota archaeon]
MKLAKNQVMLEKTLLLPDLDLDVAQELNWLLRLNSATNTERIELYEQWEAESPLVSEFGEDQTSPLSQFLMDVLHQGRVSELLASLERLATLDIQPTLPEFANLTQQLLKRPWPLSRTELEIVRILHEDPTTPVVKIAEATGYHRQTIASYMKRLYFSLQIQSYPLVNYPALGLRRMQIWFRGNAETPASVYFYSRLALTGNDERWMVDTWSIPEGAEDLVLERYRRMERSRRIYDLSVREFLSFGKHLSLSTYEESNGWRSDPEVVNLVYQRALEGQDSFIPRLLEVMPYGITQTLNLDAVDMSIIEILWRDYLLGQTREAAAIRLGISRSSFSRRLQRLESTGVIKPSLWLKTEDMVQTAMIIPTSETQVLNALMCLPVVYFYLSEARETGNREWFVVAKSAPAVAAVFADAQRDDNNGLRTFNTHIVDQWNGSRTFKAYDKEKETWNLEALCT